MTISHDVGNKTLSKRHTIREAYNQFRSTQLLCSICCHWHQWQNKKLTARQPEQEVRSLKDGVSKNTTTATVFSILIKSTIQKIQHSASTGILASFLPPPSLNKWYGRNKVLVYYCTYFNLEEKYTTCFSPHSKKHYLGILLTQKQVACDGVFNSPPFREDNMLWSYFKNISFTKVSNSVFRDRDDFLAASTSLLAWHLLQREFICCSNIKMEQEQLPEKG